jgi:N-acetylglutamate synthase-like GNAT family acetyltransferase
VGIAHPVLEQFWSSYLVIPGDEADAPLVGCVAIEAVGDVALLRMLAVAPERRGEGLGYVLVEGATERARVQGVRQLYLVTDGAQGYFGERLGFTAIDRKDVVPEIASTAEYALARSKNATWMRKEL